MCVCVYASACVTAFMVKIYRKWYNTITPKTKRAIHIVFHVAIVAIASCNGSNNACIYNTLTRWYTWVQLNLFIHLFALLCTQFYMHTSTLYTQSPTMSSIHWHMNHKTYTHMIFRNAWKCSYYTHTHTSITITIIS